MDTQSQRRILLRNALSPGDIITLTAAVRDLHLTHPGRFLTDVRTSCSALWEHNPYVTPLDEKASGVEELLCEYPLIHRSNHAPYHMIHGFRMFLEEKLGVRIDAHAFRGDIHLSAQEKSWMSQVEETEGLGTRFWIVVNGGKRDFTAKWWDPDRMQQVVDHFRSRILFVQCGEAGHFHPKLTGVVDLVGKTTLRQLIRLMYHADGVVCPVTMAMHLAAAVETRPGRRRNRPCVVIAGGREPSHWEAYPHHQYLHTNGSLPCCDQGGCWKSRVEPLYDKDPKDSSLCLYPVTQPSSGRLLPKCLDMVTVADVIRAIERYLEYDEAATSNARGGELRDTVALNEILDYAAALRWARESRLFTHEAFTALHARFRAMDSEDASVWSVGLDSGEWHKHENGGWQKGTPSGPLTLDRTVKASLDSLMQRQRESGDVPHNT